MATSHKPEGHPTVSVYLVSPDAQATCDFLATVFDASQVRRIDREDGSIMHVEMRIEDSVVMIGQPDQPGRGATSMMHVYVADPETACQKALDAGASMIHPVEHRPGDSDRRGGFADPWGNSWFVAAQVNP